MLRNAKEARNSNSKEQALNNILKQKTYFNTNIVSASLISLLNISSLTSFQLILLTLFVINMLQLSMLRLTVLSNIITRYGRSSCSRQ